MHLEGKPAATASPGCLAFRTSRPEEKVGAIREPVPEKLVIAVLVGPAEPSGGEGPGAPGALGERVARALEEEFGPLDFTSEELAFSWTAYYEKEMGPSIRRFFLSHERLVPPGALAGIKVATNRLEEGFSRGGRRRVNLDPGLLGRSRFILASTKDSSHRVPLGQGIYGEITLMYERGAFRPVEWTYPDYRSPEYRRILGEIRQRYVRQLAASGPPGP